ncbi:MAG: hypothetical protein HY914_08025 [Desulfomonile tiedjei]|nr:hypothetical protein [Desulfomonile tiedjei]
MHLLAERLSEEATQRLNRVTRELINRVAATIEAAGIRSETRLTAQAPFSALNGIMISYATYPGRSLEEIRRHTARLARLVANLFLQQAKSG